MANPWGRLEAGSLAAKAVKDLELARKISEGRKKDRVDASTLEFWANRGFTATGHLDQGGGPDAADW